MKTMTCKHMNPVIILNQISEVLNKIDFLLDTLNAQIGNGDWEFVEVLEKAKTKKRRKG